MMDVFDLIRSDGFISVNKKLACKIGLIETVIYSELVSLYKYWSDRRELVDDKWFYCTSENLEKNTSLKRKPQDRAISKLVDLGLIEVKKMGLPAKRYFLITDGIFNFFNDGTSKDVQNGQTGYSRNFQDSNTQKPHDRQSVQNGQTRKSKMDKLESPNGTLNNNRFNNNNLIKEREKKNNIRESQKLSNEIPKQIKYSFQKNENKLIENEVDLRALTKWIENNFEKAAIRDVCLVIEELANWTEEIKSVAGAIRHILANADTYRKARANVDFNKGLEERSKQIKPSETNHVAFQMSELNWLESQ